MAVFGRFLVAMALTFALVVSTQLRAQTSAEASDAPQLKVRTVPATKEPIPFSINQPNPAPPYGIRLIPAEQMSRSDQLLAADAESSIAEHAANNGFDMNEGTWSYQQIDCPAFPNHLFLKYTRNNGASDLTVFSASIPRNQEGRVRIIPILKRSYSLFAPAPINALTISAFNHIRSEDGQDNSPNWLGNGLCYAALAGANPELPTEDPPAVNKPVPSLTAVLETEPKGGAVIRFVDAKAVPRQMEWKMTFDTKGKLVKAAHTPESMITVHPIPENSAVISERPVPPATN